YVMTPFTSLLVLENEAMYKQFNVDRGRKDHWAMYPCPNKIPVVYEPVQSQPRPLTQAAQVENGSEAVLRSILERRRPRTSGWFETSDGLSNTIMFNSRADDLLSRRMDRQVFPATQPFWDDLRYSVSFPDRINMNSTRPLTLESLIDERGAPNGSMIDLDADGIMDKYLVSHELNGRIFVREGYARGAMSSPLWVLNALGYYPPA